MAWNREDLKAIQDALLNARSVLAETPENAAEYAEIVVSDIDRARHALSRLWDFATGDGR